MERDLDGNSTKEGNIAVLKTEERQRKKEDERWWNIAGGSTRGKRRTLV